MAAVGDGPMIALDDVRFRWRPAAADVLDIAKFVAKPGQRVFVKGASGSGKTTLLSLVGGVIAPQQGTVCVQGVELNALSRTQRDRFRADHIGFIFQMFNLIPYLSLTDNVTLPCRFSERRRRNALCRSKTLQQEAERLLEHLALDVAALAERPVVELSVGQQQRVAAARALIGSPAVIIADEPTSALDSDVRHSFLKLLFKEAADSGATILFVSHDPSLQDHFDETIELASINRAAVAPD